jgi:hypothetical protein
MESDQKTFDWSNCVGLDGEKAKEIIQGDKQDAQVVILHENAPTTRDFKINRVRVFVNDDGKVVKAPRPG